MPYTNLPGSYVQLQDGNLSFFTRDNRQSILVLGTATKGLTAEPFLMDDLATVIREFGATSELVKAASEVKKGGAGNIFLYRLPGTAPALTCVGAEHNDAQYKNGITIRTVQASPEAADKYSVAYRHAKCTGTAGSAATGYSVTGDLIVINTETNEVVWQGSALEGATIDAGEVDVDFDLGDVDAGVGSGVETLKLTFGGTVTAGTVKVYISGVEISVTTTSGMTGPQAAAAFKSAFDTAKGSAGTLTLPFTCAHATPASDAFVTITADGDTNASGELVYGPAHPWKGYTARPFVSKAAVLGSTGLTVTAGDLASGARGLDIGLYPQNEDLPFASVGGAVAVPLSKVIAGQAAVTSYGISGATYYWGGYTALIPLQDSGEVIKTACTYSAGATGADISAMKRFEKLHTAFEDLDLAPFDIVYPCGIALNTKNAKDTAVTFTDNVYPTPKTSLDALGYCEIRNNGDYTYSYFWSDDGTTLSIASPGPISGYSAESFSFKEVNFGYLLASYCYENSSDYRSLLGVIGTTLPASITARGVREYFGYAPTYTLNKEDNSFYIATSGDNGTGLLGFRFVGGEDDFNDGLKHGGFFLTEDRTIDYSASNLVLDDNGKKIDLGKYLLVSAIFGRVNDDINPRRSPYLTNAAGIIAGMLPQQSPSDSLINMTIPGMLIDYRLETKTVDVASGLGLVVAKNENGVAVIADSPTFASPTSDYTRLTTVRIVAKIAEELRGAARPYIGKGLTAPKRAALESAIGEVLKANMAGEPIQTITGATFKIEQSAADRVLGKMKVKLTIVPVFELRQITFSVNLSAQ